jgi:hypothetical protein
MLKYKIPVNASAWIIRLGWINFFSIIAVAEPLVLMSSIASLASGWYESKRVLVDR